MNNFIELIERSTNNLEGIEFIEQEILLLFNAIAKTENIADAELIFKSLDDIQTVLAKAAFQRGLNLSSFLREFIYNYDRIDDIEVKRNEYKKIKSKAYLR